MKSRTTSFAKPGLNPDRDGLIFRQVSQYRKPVELVSSHFDKDVTT